MDQIGSYDSTGKQKVLCVNSDGSINVSLTGNGAADSVLKTVTVTGTTAATGVWFAPAGKHVDIRSLHFTFQTGTVSDDAVALLQYLKGSTYQTLMRLGAKKDRFVDGHHMFQGHVDTDASDGTNPVIILIVTGTDSDMVASVTLEGAEE